MMNKQTIIVLAVIALAACGGGGGGGSANPPVSNPGPIATATPTTQPPVVTSIAVSLPTNAVAVAGNPQSFSVTVTVKDQHGNTMQGTYPEPITLTDNDAQGATQLSTTSVTSSTQMVALDYNGKRLSAPITISAAAQGVTSANVSPATFTADASHSYVNGDTFVFQNSTMKTTTHQNGSVASKTTTSTDTITVKSPASFNGQTNLVDVKSVDRASDNSFTNSSDSYYTYQTGSPTQLIYNGDTYANSAGGTANYNGTVTATSPSIIDELPQTVGASWNPASAAVEDDTGISSGYSYVDKIISTADGSYAEAWNLTGVGTSSQYTDYWTYNVQANGSYNITENYGDSDGFIFNTSETAEVPVGTAIPVTYNCSSGTLNIPTEPSGMPTPSAFPTPSVGATPIPNACYSFQAQQYEQSVALSTTIPNWYPTNFQPLDQEKFAVVGTDVSIPPQCNLGPTIGTKANEEQYTQSYLDPTGLAYTLSDSRFFVPNIGLVCVLENADEKQYSVTDLTGSLVAEVRTNYVHTLVNYALSPQSAGRRTESVGQVLALDFALHNRPTTHSLLIRRHTMMTHPTRT